jgi:hypothetical protein
VRLRWKDREQREYTRVDEYRARMKRESLSTRRVCLSSSARILLGASVGSDATDRLLHSRPRIDDHMASRSRGEREAAREAETPTTRRWQSEADDCTSHVTCIAPAAAQVNRAHIHKCRKDRCVAIGTILCLTCALVSSLVCRSSSFDERGCVRRRVVSSSCALHCAYVGRVSSVCGAGRRSRPNEFNGWARSHRIHPRGEDRARTDAM